MKKIILITIILGSLFATNLSYSATNQCLRFKYVLDIRSDDETTKGEVSKLQQFLKNQGHYKGDITGYYGKSTAFAVIDFQKRNGIQIDKNPWSSAIIGPKTAAKIASLTCPAVNIKSTNTPTPTPTIIKTSTPSATYTATPSYTYTATPTYTYTPSPTYSATPIYSSTPTATYTSTPTYTSSPTPTYTSTPTSTASPSSSPVSRSSYGGVTIGAAIWNSIVNMFSL